MQTLSLLLALFLLACSPLSAAVPAPFVKAQYLDANGNPLAGGLMYTYTAGTSTPLATLTDAGGLTSNANPVVLDASGYASIYLAAGVLYKFVLKNSAGTTQWTVDNISGGTDIRVYTTRAALRAVPIASIGANSGAIVLGRTTVGDGYGGMFTWSAANQSSPVSVDTTGGIFVAPTDASSGTTGAWIRSFTGDIRADWFGVSADNSTDNAIPLQLAIDTASWYANTAPITSFKALRLPTGIIKTSATILWKSCDLIGDSEPSIGTKITYTGSGSPLIQKWATSHSGNQSYGRMENIHLSGGTISLDLTANSGGVDKFFSIRHCSFSGSTTSAIKSGVFYNFDINDVRFDVVGDYAIWIVAPSGQNQSSFAIDQFTYDNGSGTSGKGFIKIDNAASFAGTFRFSNARIELNSSWASPRAFIHHLPVGFFDSAIFQMDSISFQEVTGAGGNYIFYRESATVATDKVQMRGLSITPVADWTTIGGNVSGYQVIPTIPSNGIVMHADAGAISGSSLAAAAGSSSISDDANSISVYDQPGGNNKIVLSAAGKIKLGSGSATPDIVLDRSAANTLRLATGDSFDPQSTGQTLGDSTHRWAVWANEVAVGALASLPGAGNLNVAGDVYKNGTAYTNPDYVLELAYTGAIRRFAKNPGASDYKLLSLEDTEAYARKHFRLPRIDDKPKGVFDRSDVALEKLEELYLHAFAMNRRIKELERKLKVKGARR